MWACPYMYVGIGPAKSLNDKRDDVMRRDGEREIRRVMKGGGGGGYDWVERERELYIDACYTHTSLCDTLMCNLLRIYTLMCIS